MEIPTRLRCLFTAQIEEADDSLVVEIPKDELDAGTLAAGQSYQVALLPANTQTGQVEEQPQMYERPQSQPPVEEGETRRVEIESLGDQGDGVARVERGYVVIVPDTEVGERVAIEIEAVNENVAFATVTERISYYD